MVCVLRGFCTGICLLLSSSIDASVRAVSSQTLPSRVRTAARCQPELAVLHLPHAFAVDKLQLTELESEGTFVTLGSSSIYHIDNLKYV